LNVSIIVPAYNEEHGLGGVLTQLSAALSFSRLVFVTFYIAGGLIGALAQRTRRFFREGKQEKGRG
jgi:hypothetical protein